MFSLPVIELRFEDFQVSNFQSRWSEWNLEIHWDWWPAPLFLIWCWKELNFGRYLRFFHSTHSFQFPYYCVFTTFVFSFALKSWNSSQKKTTTDTTLAHSNCTAAVFFGVGIRTSIFWPRRLGLKLDFRTILISSFCLPISRTKGITRKGKEISWIIRILN